MKHRKHQFHCQRCGSPCEIYRKGKNHRVLVCPNCGVLATNPTVAGKLLKIGASLIPGVGGVASALIGGIQDNKAEKKPKEHTEHHYQSHTPTYGERAINKELYGV